MTNPHLGFSLLSLSQSSKEITANAALLALDALMNMGVISRDTTTPPVSPADGDVYIVGSSATGAWLGKDAMIAYYQSGWNFIVPRQGLTVWSIADAALYTYTGSWGASAAVLQNLSLLGVNGTADATNKLMVASAAVLFNNIGNNVQVKINKNASGDNASFLYQTGFSGRAEFGTLGDDNFTLKVSADGSSWNNGLKILASSGRVAYKAIATGVAAAGTTQGTATALTRQLNEVTTVAASSGVVLPSPEAGEVLTVINAGANALNVYPASGHSINALAVNAAFSLAVGKAVRLVSVSASKWYGILGA